LKCHLLKDINITMRNIEININITMRNIEININIMMRNIEIKFDASKFFE